MRAFIAAVFGCMLAFAPPALAQSSGLQSFDITYAVRARGLEIGAASYAFTFQGSAYQATSDRRTTGLAHMMLGASQDFTYSARGAIDADGVHPSAYQHQGGRNRRLVRVSFGQEIVTTAQPPMGMGHPAASAAQKTGAIDQVSMVAQMLTAPDNPCGQRIRVLMDGRTLFDLTFAPNGRQSVSMAGFRGEAYRCAVSFAPIAGFSDPMAPAQLTFLLARIDGYFVPLRIEMPSEDVGIIVLEARRFNLVGAR
jgi:Protein of unknown function (DUF3108)